MAVTPPKTLRFSMDIEIQVKPRLNTGLLLYMAEHLSERAGDFFAVSLHKGRVQMRFRTGQDPITDVETLAVVDMQGIYSLLQDLVIVLHEKYL